MAGPSPGTSESGWGQLTEAVEVTDVEVVAEETIDLPPTRRAMVKEDADGEEHMNPMFHQYKTNVIKS